MAAANQQAIQRFLENCPEGVRYQVLEIIGRGSYGTVAAAVDRMTGEKVAIKRMQNVFDNVADAQRILREIKLLRLLKHPDVVEIKHIVLPSNPTTYTDVYVVFELMESDLHTVIGANDDLTGDHHRVFLYQLLRGLMHVHGMGVLHRDLKPKNILANSDCKLKICDLGLARPYLDGFGQNPMCAAWTDYVATRYYRAPELCGCFYGRYSQAVDIWSLGCIFAETLLGRPLFPGRDAVSQLQLITDLLGKPEPQVIDRISNRKARDFLHAMPPKPGMPFDRKFPNADPQALHLLSQLLSFDASERPTAAQALEHPYFKTLPRVPASDVPPVSVEEFHFEMHRLSETDVRNLIYLEALTYHPHIYQQYMPPARQLEPIMAQFDMDASADMRRQFLLAEQYGGPAAPGGAPCSIATAVPAACVEEGHSHTSYAHANPHPQVSRYPPRSGQPRPQPRAAQAPTPAYAPAYVPCPGGGYYASDAAAPAPPDALASVPHMLPPDEVHDASAHQYPCYAQQQQQHYAAPCWPSAAAPEATAAPVVASHVYHQRKTVVGAVAAQHIAALAHSAEPPWVTQVGSPNGQHWPHPR